MVTVTGIGPGVNIVSLETQNTSRALLIMHPAVPMGRAKSSLQSSA